jgi:DNA-binding FadR family transcriptional regulator
MLSETLGVTRSSVSDSALGLQATGLIHYNRGIIQIVNQRGLEAVACECYGTLRAQLARPR